mgnify:CR=1 FL=1
MACWGLAIIFQVVKLVRAYARIDKLRPGCDAELAAGQELDQPMREGVHVFHDVPAANFNFHCALALLDAAPTGQKNRRRRSVLLACTTVPAPTRPP